MDRLYDIVIFGASGFTGQFVVEEIARTAEEEGQQLKWAVAGRSLNKLQNVLIESSKQTGLDLKNIPAITADITSEESLLDMCQKTNIILNCVGPYQLYGPPVIKACIKAKTHHIDICGEPVFLEETQLVYDSQAAEAGIFILGACGWDSIPAEMGFIYTKNNFKGQLNQVESFITMNWGPDGGCGNIGTWHSAVEGYTKLGQLKKIRRQLFTTQLPKTNPVGPKRSVIFYEKDLSGWCLPFMGADRSVVMRTQRYNYEKKQENPIYFNTYSRVRSLWSVLHMMVLGLVFGIFVNFTFGRNLLLKFPWIFSLSYFSSKGPSRKQIDGCSFNMSFIAKGLSVKDESTSDTKQGELSNKLITMVSGPEMGYIATPICMVQAAYVLLKERASLPASGGVFTPGVAFAKTTLIERLEKHNIHFQIKDSN